MAVPRQTHGRIYPGIKTLALLTISSLALFQFHILFFVTKEYGETTIDEIDANQPQTKLRGNQQMPADVVEDLRDPINTQMLKPKKAELSPVECDSTPCNGFFAYSPPNTDTANASATFKHAFDRYKYGYGGEKTPDREQKEIFMPTKTDPRGCVDEWKSSRASWVER